MGDDTNRSASETEIARMKTLVDEAMREGAFGLSSGLEYEAGKPATTEELIALARVAAGYGGSRTARFGIGANEDIERRSRENAASLCRLRIEEPLAIF